MSKMLRMSPAEFKARTIKKPKYGNKKKMVGGHMFDSTKEALRYQDLALMQEARQIRGLRRQVVFPIIVNKVHVCDWIADFVYDELVADLWRTRVEDVKGFRNEMFKLKRKLVQACYPFVILET